MGLPTRPSPSRSNEWTLAHASPRYAQRAGDDLVALIGDTEIEQDGGPTDPAAWDHWLDCVRDLSLRLVVALNDVVPSSATLSVTPQGAIKIARGGRPRWLD